MIDPILLNEETYFLEFINFDAFLIDYYSRKRISEFKYFLFKGCFHNLIYLKRIINLNSNKLMESSSIIERILTQYLENNLDILCLDKQLKQPTINIAEKHGKYFLFDEKYSIEIMFLQRI